MNLMGSMSKHSIAIQIRFNKCILGIWVGLSSKI